MAEAVKRFSAPETKKPSPPTTVRQRQTITSTRKESVEKPSPRKESTEKPSLRKESTEKPPSKWKWSYISKSLQTSQTTNSVEEL